MVPWYYRLERRASLRVIVLEDTCSKVVISFGRSGALSGIARGSLMRGTGLVGRSLDPFGQASVVRMVTLLTAVHATDMRPGWGCMGFRIVIFQVVAGNVARFFGSYPFGMELFDNPALDHFAAFGVDRMRDIGIEFSASIFVLRGMVLSLPHTAMVAVECSKMILVVALGAMRRQFPTRHRDEGSVGPFDDFQVANHETIVEGNRTEALQTVVTIIHQFNSNFGDFHGSAPSLNHASPEFLGMRVL